MATAPKLYRDVAHRFEANKDAVNLSVDSRQQRAYWRRHTAFDEVSNVYKSAPRAIRRGLALMLARLDRVKV